MRATRKDRCALTWINFSPNTASHRDVILTVEVFEKLKRFFDDILHLFLLLLMFTTISRQSFRPESALSTQSKFSHTSQSTSALPQQYG